MWWGDVCKLSQQIIANAVQGYSRHLYEFKDEYANMPVDVQKDEEKGLYYVQKEISSGVEPVGRPSTKGDEVCCSLFLIWAMM